MFQCAFVHVIYKEENDLPLQPHLTCPAVSELNAPSTAVPAALPGSFDITRLKNGFQSAVNFVTNRR